ncbi:MAG: zinc-ribbon domain-containing protein [Promethearchaeota archaeon]|nr:MAG: zinc-ribbon domain-containing protein [Candidatus Lokiarchaeota archaeon]
MFCPSCGSKLRDTDQKYCENCGIELISVNDINKEEVKSEPRLTRSRRRCC